MHRNEYNESTLQRNSLPRYELALPSPQLFLQRNDLNLYILMSESFIQFYKYAKMMRIGLTVNMEQEW